MFLIAFVMYNKLLRANEFAKENLKTAQKGMKAWNDKKTRGGLFQSGDRVLAFLPVHIYIVAPWKPDTVDATQYRSGVMMLTTLSMKVEV